MIVVPSFTPAPWTARVIVLDPPGLSDCYVVGPPDRIGRMAIAEIPGSHDQRVANAYLIAAAPDLYAALVEQLAVDERKLASLEKRPYSIGLATVRARVERARYAIAKAKGVN